MLNVDDLTKEIYEEIEQYVVSSIRNYDDRISLSDKYEIDLSLMAYIVYEILHKNFDCFYYVGTSYYVAGSYKVINDITYTIAGRIVIYYSKTKDVADNELNIINSKIDEILNPLKFTRSNIDKILYINDYFVKKQYTIGSGDI